MVLLTSNLSNYTGLVRLNSGFCRACQKDLPPWEADAAPAGQAKPPALVPSGSGLERLSGCEPSWRHQNQQRQHPDLLSGRQAVAGGPRSVPSGAPVPCAEQSATRLIAVANSASPYCAASAPAMRPRFGGDRVFCLAILSRVLSQKNRQLANYRPTMHPCATAGSPRAFAHKVCMLDTV
jgi:hypothetical protein